MPFGRVRSLSWGVFGCGWGWGERGRGWVCLVLRWERGMVESEGGSLGLFFGGGGWDGWWWVL